ncbi:MAG: nicotinamide riboside transporter PnuC [Flavobacteriales bacterium]
MSAYDIIEGISVLLSLVFLVLLMRQNPWCWPFGIIGSALGAFLFVWPEAEVKLYSEAILYSYYVWIGIYGWIRWNTQAVDEPIKRWNRKKHLYAAIVALIGIPALGCAMEHFFHSNNPYIDATTTVLAFIASYMQAEKVFTSWHLWIFVNAVSIWLYWTRGLELYSVLMVVYFALSIVGLLQWKKALA